MQNMRFGVCRKGTSGEA